MVIVMIKKSTPKKAIFPPGQKETKGRWKGELFDALSDCRRVHHPD
jgi:hypothetical protein